MSTPSKKSVKRKEAESVEVEPDAWERFEFAVKKIVVPRRGKSKPDNGKGCDSPSEDDS